LERYLIIAAGAALGANARYIVGTWAGNQLGPAFPHGTLAVNITGSLMLGFVISLASARAAISPELRLFLAVGFLGSYTTFSSYTVESLLLVQSGGFWWAFVNMLANNLLGLCCALLGFFLARLLGA
jgi:CrcB protein